jgi:hypothetical protein
LSIIFLPNRFKAMAVFLTVCGLVSRLRLGKYW